MKISILIPYKPDNGSRDYIWSYIKERYEKLFPALELCVSTDESDPFCKAKAVNEAAKKASGDVFMVCDADVIFECGLISRIRQEILKYPWIQPFDICYKLTKEATERLLVSTISGLTDQIDFQPGDGEMIQLVGEAGPYINVMTRECFEAVSGFDERFKGWGWEDIAFAYALDKICGYHHQINATIYHLWHNSFADCASVQYQKNEALMRRYKEAGSKCFTELKKVIAEQFETI